MLCPKCGFISFDNLTECSKCQHDLSELKASLNGTAIQVENNYFLDPEDLGEDEPISEEIETTVIEENAETSPDDLAEQELPPEPETPELSVDLDDMPPIDLSEIKPEEEDIESLDLDNLEIKEPPELADSDTEQPVEEKEPEIEVAEVTEEITVPEEPTITEDIEEPLDTESLTLEINDEEPELELAVADTDESEDVTTADNNETESVQIPINLEEIDLSDLVHSSEKTPEPPQDASSESEQATESTTELVLEDDSQPDNSTLDLDSLDLNLEEDDVTVSNDQELVFDTDDNSNQDNLEAIDLTLELDSDTEEINMSLDDILEETDKT